MSDLLTKEHVSEAREALWLHYTYIRDHTGLTNSQKAGYMAAATNADHRLPLGHLTIEALVTVYELALGDVP